MFGGKRQWDALTSYAESAGIARAVTGKWQHMVTLFMKNIIVEENTND
jgi:hypothetical protein